MSHPGTGSGQVDRDTMGGLAERSNTPSSRERGDPNPGGSQGDKAKLKGVLDKTKKKDGTPKAPARTGTDEASEAARKVADEKRKRAAKARGRMATILSANAETVDSTKKQLLGGGLSGTL